MTNCELKGSVFSLSNKGVQQVPLNEKSDSVPIQVDKTSITAALLV